MATVDPLIECPGVSYAIILDGSGSTDPDSAPGTNSDIVSFEWYAGYGTADQLRLAMVETATVDLLLGTHSITLKVTDSDGAIDTDTVQVTIDPAMLSMLKLEKAEIDWPVAPETLAHIKLHGLVALPVGVHHWQLAPTCQIRLDLAGVPDLLSQTVTYEALGFPVDKWEYRGSPLGQGIEDFKVY